jgi:CBS domain-containing protein
MTDTVVREIMTEPVMTVEPDEPLSEVAWAMERKAIRSLAVVDAACRPVGILTSTDFIHMAADEADPAAATVGDYMTTDVETTAADAAVTDVADRLLSGGFNHMPVVDADGGVVGILSSTDLLRRLSGADAPEGAA